MNSKNIPQAEISTKDHRPWGWFEVLNFENNFKVKKLFINPKESMFTSHKYRSEHWIIVSGIAEITIGKNKNILSVGDYFVPQKEIHRVENPGKIPVIIIEVQLGDYLGEDDIIRYEDVYSRDIN